MIPPTPGPDPASRLFGTATPPDGAGPIGPDQLWPTAIHPSHEEMMHALNPVHYVPIVGTLYRLVTGETIPAPLRVFSAGITGGPVGMLLAGFGGVIEGIIGMKPDLSRPSTPAGMAVAGNEIGMSPVSPGTLESGAYTTLATTTPEWLQSDPSGQTRLADQVRGSGAYRQAALEWQRTEALEKGLA